MKILGISAFYHDAASAIIEDGIVVAAAHEERFTRKKYEASFPVNAIKFCLQYNSSSLTELDAIAFYDKPFLKFERLLETYYANAPKGFRSFAAAIPVWIREKLFIKQVIKQELKRIEKFDVKKIKLLFPEHHLSHAASAFYPSPFDEAAILTVDGVGEWATATISHAKLNTITILKEMRFPDSVGLLYSAFTYYLGFRVNSGEQKLMGLAPYGSHQSEQVHKFERIIREHLVHIYPDGSIKLNQEYFDYTTGLKMVQESKWEGLFGFPRRSYDSEIKQNHCDLALAIQKITEEIVLNMAREAKRLTKANALCLAGGVALNCVVNSKLKKAKIFNDIYIQPAAGDAGGALGAALAAYHIYFNRSKKNVAGFDAMSGSLLGPSYSDDEVRVVLEKNSAQYEYVEKEKILMDKAATLLAEGKVIGWFQGRMEWGPRALGNRSIIADPRSPNMQRRLNEKIKYREDFRPFAPAVLLEDAQDFFEIDFPSPYMLFIANVAEKRRNSTPVNYEQLSMRGKLDYIRSDIPAVTHVDFSARVQTVDRTTNERFWKLIRAFKKKTNYGVIINTSFNVRGEPIVCTPDDAYNCFMRTGMDYLVINNFILDKSRTTFPRNLSSYAEQQ